VYREQRGLLGVDEECRVPPPRGLPHPHLLEPDVCVRERQRGIEGRGGEREIGREGERERGGREGRVPPPSGLPHPHLL